MRSRNRSNPFCSPVVINLCFAGLSAISSSYDESGEAIRQSVNKWIRSTDAFDAIIDFDKTICDPEIPTRVRQEYDSGDHIHPSAAGYKAMADAVDLALLRRIKPVKEAKK
jgi:lysophospholipase L1-like esterase